MFIPFWSQGRKPFEMEMQVFDGKTLLKCKIVYKSLID
jgi:hypothetical protein